MLQALLLLLASLVSACIVSCIRDVDSADCFPADVPLYEVRLDAHTKEPVSNGRMHLINYVAKGKMIPPDTPEQQRKMIPFEEMHKHLQCASPEPELDGNRGAWSLLKLAPTTKESLELICAWAESKCRPWVTCRDTVAKFRKGEFEPGMDDLGSVWFGRTAILLRVIDNHVHYDWPWGIERFQGREDHYSNLLTDHFSLIEMVLRTVSGIGDSVFFFGGEQPFLQWNVPVPLFSFAPDIMYGDLPFPWLESYRLEWEHYKRAERARNFSDSYWTSEQTPWNKRIPKAAFFASMQGPRQLVYDSAALRPDLFDVGFSPGNLLQAWNPLSDEPDMGHFGEPEPVADPNPKDYRQHPGFLQPILPFNNHRTYTPHQYKYVVVPVGSGALSTSGRLAGLLAHSGAVVLLQGSSFSYHFSARLQPWVHYVPLSFSMADIIAKVEWLQQHDDLAQRIAQNAANFARSYLRLEDYFCYAATSLRLLSDMQNRTDVLQGFSPRKIHRKPTYWG